MCCFTLNTYVHYVLDLCSMYYLEMVQFLALHYLFALYAVFLPEQKTCNQRKLSVKIQSMVRVML